MFVCSEASKAPWYRIDIYVGCLLIIVASAAARAAGMNWFDARERMTLLERFPVKCAEERAACTRVTDAHTAAMLEQTRQAARFIQLFQTCLRQC